jgi:hypothetical protein
MIGASTLVKSGFWHRSRVMTEYEAFMALRCFPHGGLTPTGFIFLASKEDGMSWVLQKDDGIRPARANRARIPLDYFMLLQPRPDGPPVGVYAGREIPAAVIDADGRRYLYAGVAPRLLNGSYDLNALGQDEWLVEPGLVYCGARENAGGAYAGD